MLTTEQAAFLYYSSHSYLATVAVALATHNYNIALSPAAVFLTSINYWRDPKYGWRKNIDAVVACTSIVVHEALAIQLHIPLTYIIITNVGLLSYPIGVALMKYENKWPATVTHAFLHLYTAVVSIALNLIGSVSEY